MIPFFLFCDYLKGCTNTAFQKKQKYTWTGRGSYLETSVCECACMTERGEEKEKWIARALILVIVISGL